MILLWCAVAVLTFAWFAGDAVLGGIVAPQLFQHARAENVGDAFAGLVFGDVLNRWVVVAGLICVIPTVCLLAAATGRALKLGGKRAAWLPAIACVVLLAMHATTVTFVKEGNKIASQLRKSPDPERQLEFKTGFHERSRMIFTLEMLVALSVAVGAAIAAKRAGTVMDSSPQPPASRIPRTTV
ncbi:MAG: hypothetical protein AAB263_17275 [Planctomycetota bacterium]